MLIPKSQHPCSKRAGRIYLETHWLPLSINEHAFWGSDDRGPPYRYFADAVHRRTDIYGWSEALTEQQRGAVGEIHLFAQQFFLESMVSQSSVKRLEDSVWEPENVALLKHILICCVEPCS